MDSWCGRATSVAEFYGTMPRMPKRIVGVALVVLLATTAVGSARAQDVAREDFWPELDAYVRLGSNARVMAMASGDRSREGDFQQATVGFMLEGFAKSFAHEWLDRHPDLEKRRHFAFRGGYRYIWDRGDKRGDYKENRILVEGTVRAPIHRFSTGVFNAASIANRSRVEWRDIDDAWSWRFRNRTRLEGDLAMGSRTMSPYLMAEFFYDDRYAEWNRQRYYAGIDWPVFSQGILDTYYCRQNDSRSSVAHVNALGVTLRVYF